MKFFTFLDGALGYDCVRCGARCCKGNGFALPAPSLLPLLARAPVLSPFAQLHSGTAHALTFGDGCLMLADDGRCGVETAHGRAAKPAICRLFPMQVFSVGEHCVVDLKFRGCPLQAAAELRSAPGVTVIHHHDLVADLDEPGASAFFIQAQLPADSPADALEREDQHTQATADRLRNLDATPDALPAIYDSAQRSTIDALYAQWQQFFAIDPAEVTMLSSLSAQPFLLTLPSLRFGALLAKDSPPYIKLKRTLPAQLAASLWLTLLAARSGRRPTPRLCVELWHALPFVRRALSRFGRQVTLHDKPLPDQTPDELRLAYDQTALRLRDQSLGQALLATSLSQPLRPLLLRLVSDRLI